MEIKQNLYVPVKGGLFLCNIYKKLQRTAQLESLSFPTKRSLSSVLNAFPTIPLVEL